MKKIISTRLLEQKIYRRRNKWNDYKTKKNRISNAKKKEKPNFRDRFNPFRTGTKVIAVPPRFSLLENTEIVLRFAEDCKQLKQTNIKNVLLDFSKVVEISHGSMALMLSVVHDLNLYNIIVGGMIPDSSDAKEKFIQSGFLDFFESRIGGRSQHKNTIVVSGGGKIDQIGSAPEVEDAMETVFEKKSRNQKLQGMIIEMMTNSVNHAFINQHKNTKWYLSAFHEEDAKRVKFCFVDNGSGVLRTIQKKFWSEIATHLGGEEIIIKAFNGDFGSRTKQRERGTGLITIKSNFTENVINKLKVVTNNYFYDFDNQIVKKLKNGFNGTFYFWELDETCKNVNY